MDFFNFRSATGFVSTRPFPPSPAAPPKPMPSEHRERWAGLLVRNMGYPTWKSCLRDVWRYKDAPKPYNYPKTCDATTREIIKEVILTLATRSEQSLDAAAPLSAIRDKVE